MNNPFVNMRYFLMTPMIIALLLLSIFYFDYNLFVTTMLIIALLLLLFFYFAFLISKNAKQINIRNLIFYRKAFIIVLEIFFVSFLLSLRLDGLSIFVIFFYVFFRWKIQLFKPIYTHKVVDEIDSFILYLRSFKDDRKNKFSLNERKIVKVFNRIFPVYAVGCPTELLPAAGAKRIYIADDWQNQVEKLVHKAKFILLKISDTEHFLWESKLCIQNIGTDKLIFFCTQDTKSAYDSFQVFLKTSFNIDIPSYDVSSTKNFFIYFKGGIAVRKDYSSGNVESIAMSFLDDHPKINEENEELLKRENGLFLKLFSLKKDKSIDRDLQKWNWSAFFLTWRTPGNYPYSTFALFFIIEFLVIFLFKIDSLPMYLEIQYYHPTLFSLIENSIFFVFPLYIIYCCFWGYNGNKLSWLSKRWDGKKYFKRVREEWNIAGIIILVINIIGLLLEIINSI